MNPRLPGIHAFLLLPALLGGTVPFLQAGQARKKNPPLCRTSIPVTGDSSPGLASFDETLIAFIEKKGIPGAALAVVKKGRLVLARGYGWSDPAAKKPVLPTSLFRVASLSKAVTAAAVLQLADRGKLSLDAPVLGLPGLIPLLPKGKKVDPRLKSVTIGRLLHHTGGFDRKASFDPMFRSIEIARSLGIRPPARQADIIRYMLGRPLDFDPGARFAYSNFGYCLLGRVIEGATGMTYENYVVKNVLGPLGIRRMKIGKSLAAERAPGEVTYHAGKRKTASAVSGKIGAPVPPPYGGFYLEAMDSHGGWIASVVDMARFASAFDDPRHCPILSEGSVRRMFSRPFGPAGFDEKGRPKAAYYACGWMVRPVGKEKADHWHTGSLPGTATLMVRRHDGLCWVVFFNTRHDPAGGSLTREIDPLLHRAADSVETWPSLDLFPKYLRLNKPGAKKEGH